MIVITKILQITSKLTELLDSQVPDSSHDFDPIKQVDDEEDDDVDDVTNMIGVPSIHPHQGQKNNWKINISLARRVMTMSMSGEKAGP